MKACLLLFASLSIALHSACGAALDDFEARTFTASDGTRLPYRLFVPAGYEASGADRFPLIVFLHGAGERGSDNRSQLTVNPAPLALVSGASQSKHPAFMVAPQCPANSHWLEPGTRRNVYAVIEQLMSQFRVDAYRVYVTGLSMGGAGTTAYLSDRPDLFAAGVSMSAPIALSGKAPEAPFWLFQGAQDNLTPVRQVRRTVEMVRRLGVPVIYTEFDSGGHDIWGSAYETPGLLDWLMSQVRGRKNVSELGLSIASPTTDFEYRHLPNEISLKGTARHPLAGIDSVRWKNHTTGESGVATGTTAWSAEGIALRPGSVNEITVWSVSANPAGSPAGTTTLAGNLRIVKDSNEWIPQSRAIGLNFVGAQNFGVDGRLGREVRAGLFPQTNWNNGAGGQGTLTSTVDSAGESQPARLQWNAASGTSEWGFQLVYGDSRMMDGVLMAGSRPITITASEIPYPVYDVILYFTPWGQQASISLDGERHTFSLDDSLYYMLYEEATSGSSQPAIGNYVRYRRLTGKSFELQITGPGPVPAALSAMQIVAVPQLVIQQEGAQTRVAWPDVFSDARLEAASEANQGDWTTVSRAPSRRDGALEIRENADGNTRFFRLRLD